MHQIVSEHYQSTCTPQPSVSKFPPITPSVDKNAFAGQEEACLPPELCSNCSHGCKVYISSAFFSTLMPPQFSPSLCYSLFWKLMQLGLCPEAAGHVREMKDMLIAVSNELLDNATNLNSEEIEKLRQDRFVLIFVTSFPPFIQRGGGV